MIKQISIKTARRVEMVDITAEVQKAVRESGLDAGVCHVFVPHTTAGVTINEGADPSVARDIEAFLSKVVPHGSAFTHAEGNSDSHIKTLMTGSSETIFVEGGRLVLGTWQAVFFCEYDGPRARKVLVKLHG